MPTLSLEPLKKCKAWFDETFSGIVGAEDVHLGGTAPKTVKSVPVQGISYGYTWDKFTSDETEALVVLMIHLDDPSKRDRRGQQVSIYLTTDDAHTLGLGLVDQARVSDQKFSGKLG